MNKENISIIISAYEAQDFIEDCLNSIENQSYFKKYDVKYEILLGIDGCEKTLKKIEEIKDNYENLRIYNMLENKGVYVTLNTLIDYIKYDYIIRFDADDVMKYDMIEKIVDNNDDYDVINFKSYSFTDSIKDVEESSYAHGVCFYNKRVFDKAGGFKNWICAADTEFYQRIKRYVKRKYLDEYLFFRRYHKNNLTTRKDTGHNSVIRNNYIKKIKNFYFINEIFLDKKINENHTIIQ